jgi:hypothetical protein
MCYIKIELQLQFRGKKMSFTKDELDIVLTTIHNLAELAAYKKAISSEVVKETNIKSPQLSDIVKYAMDEGYLEKCAHAAIKISEQGGTIGLKLTSYGISYVINLNN